MAKHQHTKQNRNGAGYEEFARWVADGFRYREFAETVPEAYLRAAPESRPTTAACFFSADHNLKMWPTRDCFAQTRQWRWHHGYKNQLGGEMDVSIMYNARDGLMQCKVRADFVKGVNQKVELTADEWGVVFDCQDPEATVKFATDANCLLDAIFDGSPPEPMACWCAECYEYPPGSRDRAHDALLKIYAALSGMHAVEAAGMHTVLLKCFPDLISTAFPSETVDDS